MRFNKKIKEIEQKIKEKKKELKDAVKKESEARKKWVSEHRKFKKASKGLATLKIHGTKREKDLRKIVLGFDNQEIPLTKLRDSSRNKMKQIQDELVLLSLELARLGEKEGGETTAIDEIVKQVFSLNDVVVTAANNLQDCLKRYVFPRLFSEDGKLRSQITFDSSDGLRRVRAMVNTMTVVKTDLAKQAQEEIEKFFARFQSESMGENVRAMYELTKQILTEKITFKVGPSLYQFLSMELDEKIFPELALAQHLLQGSIRFEKTTSYVRLSSRTSRASKWVAVKQS